jgi:hypothetical protein
MLRVLHAKREQLDLDLMSRIHALRSEMGGAARHYPSQSIH